MLIQFSYQFDQTCKRFQSFSFRYQWSESENQGKSYTFLGFSDLLSCYKLSSWNHVVSCLQKEKTAY